MTSSSQQLHDCLERMQAGDADAREQLIVHSCDRLQKLVRKMLKQFPRVKRWEETDDVYQNVVLRLMRALREMQPESVRHFLSLSATIIRRELCDLARHYYGPEGAGAHHVSDMGASATAMDRPQPDRSDRSNDPGRLVAWRELHERIAGLPEEEREVCDLLWYQGLSQPAAAKLLEISERTLKRRWQAVRLKLHQILPDGL